MSIMSHLLQVTTLGTRSPAEEPLGGKLPNPDSGFLSWPPELMAFSLHKGIHNLRTSAHSESNVSSDTQGKCLPAMIQVTPYNKGVLSPQQSRL